MLRQRLEFSLDEILQAQRTGQAHYWALSLVEKICTCVRMHFEHVRIAILYFNSVALYLLSK